jgi:hypothetical protein
MIGLVAIGNMLVTIFIWQRMFIACAGSGVLTLPGTYLAGFQLQVRTWYRL